MGSAVAERVLAAGYPLLVYNRTPEKARALVAGGASVAASPAEVASKVDVVITSLANDEAFEAVAREVVAEARPGTALVDLSTVSPEASARIAAKAEAASVPYLRAPVSGNPTVVRAGNLSFMLAINLMIAGLAELMSEALVLGEAAGVGRADILEVMGSSAAGAPFVKYKTEPLLRDDFSATFTTALMEKDIDLVLDAAEDLSVELPIAKQMKTLLRAAIEAGYADDDFMALFLHLQSAPGFRDQEVVR